MLVNSGSWMRVHSRQLACSKSTRAEAEAGYTPGAGPTNPSNGLAPYASHISIEVRPTARAVGGESIMPVGRVGRWEGCMSIHHRTTTSRSSVPAFEFELKIRLDVGKVTRSTICAPTTRYDA